MAIQKIAANIQGIQSSLASLIAGASDLTMTAG